MPGLCVSGSTGIRKHGRRIVSAGGFHTIWGLRDLVELLTRLVADVLERLKVAANLLSNV